MPYSAEYLSCTGSSTEISCPRDVGINLIEMPPVYRNSSDPALKSTYTANAFGKLEFKLSHCSGVSWTEMLPVILRGLLTPSLPPFAVYP